MQKELRFVQARGQSVPALGFGTWQLEGQSCREAVADAIAIGYRHIDTAQAYDNEEDVGAGIRASGADEEQVWITSKVWWENLAPAECLASARRSRDRLDVERIDLMLVHWPTEELPLDEPLAALQELREEGVIGHLGVSNFTPELLEQALESAPILTNQVEYHPFLAQDELLRVTRDNDLFLTAYSPVAHGAVADDETLIEIGHQHDKTPAQVALRWLLQQDAVAAIPRSSDPEHRRENFAIFDFELSATEMARISALDRGMRIVDPDFAPAWSG